LQFANLAAKPPIFHGRKVREPFLRQLPVTIPGTKVTTYLSRHELAHLLRRSITGFLGKGIAPGHRTYQRAFTSIAADDHFEVAASPGALLAVLFEVR
jgi:hypothetical protein